MSLMRRWLAREWYLVIQSLSLVCQGFSIRNISSDQYLSLSISLSLPEIVHGKIIIFFWVGKKSFHMWNWYTLTSSLKILPVLSQKYAIPPFRDFWESQNPIFSLFPNHYMLYLDPIPRQLLRTILISLTSASRRGGLYRWGEG